MGLLLKDKETRDLGIFLGYLRINKELNVVKLDEYSQEDLNFLIGFICDFEKITNLNKLNSIDFLVLGMAGKLNYKKSTTYGVQSLYEKNKLTFKFEKKYTSIFISILSIKTERLYNRKIIKINFNKEDIKTLNLSAMFNFLKEDNYLELEFDSNIEDEAYDVVCFNDKWTYGIQKPSIEGAPNDENSK